MVHGPPDRDFSQLPPVPRSRTLAFTSRHLLRRRWNADCGRLSAGSRMVTQGHQCGRPLGRESPATVPELRSRPLSSPLVGCPARIEPPVVCELHLVGGGVQAEGLDTPPGVQALLDNLSLAGTAEANDLEGRRLQPNHFFRLRFRSTRLIVSPSGSHVARAATAGLPSHRLSSLRLGCPAKTELTGRTSTSSGW
jgi:hypothetical protein